MEEEKGHEATDDLSESDAGATTFEATAKSAAKRLGFGVSFS